MLNLSSHFKYVEDLKTLWPFLKPHKKEIGIMLVLIFISAGLALVTPYIYKIIIDILTNTSTSKITMGEATTTFIYIAIAYMLVQIALAIIKAQSFYAGEKFINKTTKEIKVYSIDKILGFDYSFAESQSTGRTIQKIDKGTANFTQLSYDCLYLGIPNLFTLIIAICILFSFNFWLAILSILGIPFYLYIVIKYSEISRKNEIKATPFYEKAAKQMSQSLFLFGVVKSHVRELMEKRIYNQQLGRAVNYSISGEKAWRNAAALREVIVALNIFLMLVIGGYLAFHGEITAGTVVMFMVYMYNIYTPITYMSYVYNRLRTELVRIRRLTDLLFKTPQKITDSQNAIDLKKVSGEIELKNVSFNYENNKNICVLEKIDLKIKPREKIAIVGISGSGKSTLAKLLLRFYDVNKGQILIDGKDIKEVTQKSLRENIAYVSQDSGIFDDTIRANIKYGKLNATDKEVEEAAKQANIHDFIMKTLKGYKTIVGERGIKLSGGEKQRVAIARAFLKNAPILVLDEATSSLDSESEEKVQDAFWKLAKGKTTIIIAHRLSTVMKADKIVVIDKGRIAETGSHKELLKKKKGLYAKLFNIQSGSLLLE